MEFWESDPVVSSPAPTPTYSSTPVQYADGKTHTLSDVAGAQERLSAEQGDWWKNDPIQDNSADQQTMLKGMEQADQAMRLLTLPMNMPPEPPKAEQPQEQFNGIPNLTMLRQGKVMSANQMPTPDASLLYSLGIPQPFAQQEDVPGELGPPNITALRQGRVEQLPTDKKVKEAFAAIGNLPVDAANFALSPAGLATGAILPQLAPWIQRTVAAGFTTQQAYQAAEAPTLQGKIEALLGAGLGAAGVVKGPKAIEALKSKEELPNVETPNISPARATENLGPTETSGTLGQVDGPVAPNAVPETGPAPGPAPVGETPQNPQVIAQQQRMKAAEAKIEADRVAANAAPPDQQITKSAQEIYDSAAKAARTSTAGGAGPIEQRIENVVAEKRALLNRLYQMEPWRGPIPDPVKLAFERAHDMATQFAEAQHGALLPENRPNRFQGYSVEPPQLRVSEPEATPKANPQPVRESATTATAPVDIGSPPARLKPTPEIPLLQVEPEAPQTAPEPAGGIPEPVQPENPVTGQQDAGTGASGQPQTTGVRNKTLEDLAAKGQTDVVPPGAGLSTAELVAKGRSAILNGVDPYEVARTATKTNAVSPDQFGVLRAHAADLHTRSEALRTEMERNPTPENKAAFEQAYQDFSKWNKDVVQPAKTRTSDVFRAMQGEEPINAADYTGMREAMEQRIQRGLNPMEETVLKNRAKTVEKVTQRRSQAIDALDKEIKRSSKPTVKLKSMDELRQMVAEKLKSIAPCA